MLTSLLERLLERHLLYCFLGKLVINQKMFYSKYKNCTGGANSYFVMLGVC